MKTLIVEDERLSAERLQSLLNKVADDIEVLEILPSVKDGLKWFSDNDLPDLVFFDIQLSDGTAFDILQSLEKTPPVIFTTAYDEYAVRAFKFKSIDYLLKPIDEEELGAALAKFQDLKKDSVEVKEINQILKNDYKKRFLIKIGEQYQTVQTEEIAYAYYDSGMTYLVNNSQKRFPMDISLDQLESQLNPLDFFRINRQFLVSLQSIHQIHMYFNSRLLLKLRPEPENEVIVSRERVGDFKKWMDC